MSIGRFSNVHSIVDNIIEQVVNKKWICIDATVGNGNDALKIIKKLSLEGKFYGFDIQKEAINNTIKLLKHNGLFGDNVQLIQDNHMKFSKYVNSKIDFFIMNLGYLPGGDKSITTNWKSTLKFVSEASSYLNIGGIGIIVFYPGHKEGLEELINITSFLCNLDQKTFNVFNTSFINQKNNPPQLIVIERI